MDRDAIQTALTTLSQALYRGSNDEREEIKDHLLNLVRVADNYLDPPSTSGLTARHVQSSR